MGFRMTYHLFNDPVIIKCLQGCIMRRNYRLDIFHMRLRESPMFRDIRIIKIDPVMYNRREDVDKTCQCTPHKLDTFGRGFVCSRH